MKASRTVKANYTTPRGENKGGLEFDITGRSPTVLSYGNHSPQGDHVTACRLIEEGLYRRLDFLSKAEIEELSEKENRDNLRARRKALYDYISAIAILDPKRRNSLYEAVDSILRIYNSHRHKKTDIKITVEQLHKTSNRAGLAYNSALKSIDSQFKENGEKMQLLFQEIASLIITFYNKIPLTAFHEIEGFEEGGGDIKVTRRIINEIFDWHRKQKNPSSEAIAAKLPTVVEAINSLIHYPEITDKKKLTDHLSENITKKGKTNQPRNNSKETLIEILARHIHIFFAVYPELKTIFNKNDELIDKFIDKFINKIITVKGFIGKDIKETKQPNWPSLIERNDPFYKFVRKNFANWESLINQWRFSTDIAKIKLDVKDKVRTLDFDTEFNHYDIWRKKVKEERDIQLDSSEDEEISTKPKTKENSTVKATLTYSDAEDSETESQENSKKTSYNKVLKKPLVRIESDSDFDSQDKKEFSKPKNKLKPQSVVNLEATQSEIDALRKEAEELRKLKEILEKNRSKIPADVMKEIDRTSTVEPVIKGSSIMR